MLCPNKKNFSNFGLNKKKVIKKKNYIYKKLLNSNLQKKMHNNFCIDEIKNFKSFIKNTKSFFLKDFFFFKKRYLNYNKNDYFINVFKLKNLLSFFIIKKNVDKSGSNLVILDHFGSIKIKSKHLFHLTMSQNNLIFLSKKKINQKKYKLIDNITFKIGTIKNISLNQKKILINKDIFLGDTDIFITTSDK